MTTKKQHYVWREYLRKFCFDKDRIYSLIKNEKIVPNNLMNIGQENFFYKAHDLDRYEIHVLENFVHDFFKDMKEFDFVLEYFQTLLLRLKLISLKNSGLLDQESIRDFEAKYQNDFFEDTLTKIENRGKILINIKNVQDLEVCLNDKNLFQTLQYLNLQFLRTKRQKQMVLERLDIENVNGEKIWFFTTLVISHSLTINLTFRFKRKVILLKNETSQEFITSDQPIINLKEEIRDDNGFTKELNLYYPLSPNLAIIFDFHVDNNSIAEEFITDIGYVNQLNDAMAKTSEMFIFSKALQSLEKYKNSVS